MEGRSGTLEQLRYMIEVCRSNGVRVYADAVVNHMAGNGNDILNHRVGGNNYCNYWGGKITSAGVKDYSPYFTHGFTYQLNNNTGLQPTVEFPGVPYGPLHFHCERPIQSWSSGFDLNYGWLVGLADLNTEHPYVQQRIADYFTALLGVGFSGFRLDAAKHISPADLAQIFARFKANLGGGDLPQDFVTYLEVIIGGEKDLLMCQADNPYSYSTNFVNLMKQAGLSDNDIYRIKIWDSTYPKEFPICGYWVIVS